MFKNFVGMVTLDQKAYEDASKAGPGTAALSFLVAALAMSLGLFWINWDVISLIGGVIGGFIGMAIGFFIVVFIFWIFAKMFGGKGAYGTHYVALSHLALWSVLFAIPFIGPVIAVVGEIWSIVMSVFITKHVHKLSTGKAAAAVIIPYAIFLLLLLVFIALVIALLVGMGVSIGGLEALGV